MKRGFSAILLTTCAFFTFSGFAEANKTGFDIRGDTVAFSNDTAWDYGPDASGNIVPKGVKRKKTYAHNCFILSRSTLQFRKFARFDPTLPRVSKEEYKHLVQHICRIPTWFPERKEKIVIPGYKNLWQFSIDYQAMLEDNLGNWLMTYLRLGNWRMCMGHPRGGQELAAERVTAELDRGQLQAVYLARFPHMNHCVILYDYTRKPNGDLQFSLYDPNYPGEPAWLKYHAAKRTFEFQKRWYFNQGTVNVMRVYLSPIQ